LCSLRIYKRKNDQPKNGERSNYKGTRRRHRWGPTLHEWLGSVTNQMLDMAEVGKGMRVLDVAAGAGEQTITVAKCVGPTGYVLATDISSKILDYAQKSARQSGLSNVETKVMDGENLELPDASFDFVMSRVGLIYFPDHRKALIEMRRVLKPGGRIGAITYSVPENNKFFSVPVSIIRSRAKLPPPLPGQPGPFSLGAPGVLEEAYRKAGFNNTKVRTVASPLGMASAAECVRFERESFGALHQMLAGVPDGERSSVWDEIEQALKQFEGADGFVGPCEMLIAIGLN